MITRSIKVASAVFLLTFFANKSQAITLGSYNFNAGQFGDTLAQSDGGGFASANWLNVVNVDPGSPAYLTGANFNTGVANIDSVIYTIGYTSGISNVSGSDIGIVTARFSVNDSISLAVSTDGVTFTAPIVFSAAAASSTGTQKDYFYGGSGLYTATLFVTSVDLSAFGIAADTSIKAVRVTGSPELDLIRVAGFSDRSAAPEPASWAMMVSGFGLVGSAMRRRRTNISFA